jgi:hypothetical protein
LFIVVDAVLALLASLAGGHTRNHVRLPGGRDRSRRGAQKLADVCKGTWAEINDDTSELSKHDKAVDSFEAAMNELNDMGVHVNNEGEFPVFTSGTKEAACGPSALLLLEHLFFLKLSSTVELSTLTTLVDLSKYRTFKR